MASREGPGLVRDLEVAGLAAVEAVELAVGAEAYLVVVVAEGAEFLAFALVFRLLADDAVDLLSHAREGKRFVANKQARGEMGEISGSRRPTLDLR